VPLSTSPTTWPTTSADSCTERRRRGTRAHTRALTCFRQAVLGLRWFRHNSDVTTLARDHGIARAARSRYPTGSRWRTGQVLGQCPLLTGDAQVKCC
jgi:hypothetical protein